MNLKTCSELAIFPYVFQFDPRRTMLLLARQGISAAGAALCCYSLSFGVVSSPQVVLPLAFRTLHNVPRQTAAKPLFKSQFAVAAAGLFTAGVAAFTAIPSDDSYERKWSFLTALADSRNDGSSPSARNPIADTISSAVPGSTYSSSIDSTPTTSNCQNCHKTSNSSWVTGQPGGPLAVVKAELLAAPNVPAPINRSQPVRMQVELNTTCELATVGQAHKYPVWTFNGTVPGPMIRCRVGDELEMIYTNLDKDGIGHNIDFHSVTGPGGGAPVLYAEQGETKTGVFKMLYPGAFIYHCSAAPVPMHIANGMYGLLVVEPEEGLPKVDKEFYVMQSEFYAEDDSTSKDVLEPSYWEGLRENPTYVVFNGREGALTDQPLLTEQGDRARLFVGNAGPNLVSSFHMIGCIFDKVYREGDLISPPARGLQTTLIPAGGAAVVEVDLPVPGNFTLIDHSIFRMDKGAIGFLKVKPGQKPEQLKQADDIYHFEKVLTPCPGCKLHN